LHQAIEAKENVKVEAATQTFATVTLQNFFRMYHKLAGMTGTAETEAGELWEIYKLDVVVIPTNRPIVRNDIEDMVYKTIREKYNAIIDETVKLVEAGRPVLVGTTSVETSELLSRMLTLRKIKHNVLNAKQHQREADIVAEAGQAGTVTIATNMAGRGTDIKLGAGVKAAGGLAIIGTERHESRRVDRQLRGRAGRQGDPGSSQFFVSLEDNLMRLFGSERISKVMDTFGYKEGEVIQHSMITRSIERAQKKVEENNFGIRKRLLEYDDVMNSQREVIYRKRRHALYGERLSTDIRNMISDVAADLVERHRMNEDYEAFMLDVIRNFAMDTKINAQVFSKNKIESLLEELGQEALQAYDAKNERLAKMAMPVITTVFQDKGEQVENIVVPFQMGNKGMQVGVNLRKAYESECREIVTEFEKVIMLMLIDEAWKNHLRDMDELKQSVQNAVYEQKDPLVVYKMESFNLFERMLSELNSEAVGMLFQGTIPVQEADEVREQRQVVRAPQPALQANKPAYTSSSSAAPQAALQPGMPQAPAPHVSPVHVGPKVGRNDPCPCGSGKKFKSCHGKEEA
jgi:preprotein translocase subunit SecA